MFKYYDVHTHINYEPLVQQADQIAKTCLEQGIMFNNIGTNITSSLIAIEQANKYDNVYAFVGIHPNDTNDLDVDVISVQLENMIKNNKKIIGVGETGLDYHYANFDRSKQIAFFIAHIKLARKYDLPLMVHVRDAHDDVYKILYEYAKGMRVVIHCFSGDEAIAKAYTNLGFYLSIPGIITFKNANALRQAIKVVPTSLLLAETDAPWLTPTPHRGKTNSPEYIPYIVAEIAKVLDTNEEDMKSILFNNAIKLLNV